MGLFKNMKDMQSQAQEAMANQGGMGSGMGGMPAWATWARRRRTRSSRRSCTRRVSRRPASCTRSGPRGQTDIGGGQQVEFDVSIRPADG